MRCSIATRPRSQNYTLNLAGSRCFIEHAPIIDYRTWTDACATANCRWPSKSPLALPATCCGARTCRSAPGSTAPCRSARKPSGLRSGHAPALAADTGQRTRGAQRMAGTNVETRFRYNPDVKSLPAMVPAVIPLLLLMLPAMLTALAVVRERDGIDHQSLRDAGHAHRVPAWQAVAYVGLAMVNFLLMSLLAVTIFGVPVRAASSPWRWPR